MVVLKKIKAATLIETITASVLIVIVFSIALFTLNNVFLSTIKRDTSGIENHIYQLEYRYKNKLLSIPLTEEFNNWEVSGVYIEENGLQWLELKAIHSKYKNVVTKRIVRVKN
ncbi:hypothetical protein [Lutibacter sp.]